MSDDIRRWSEELARDPSSLVFLQLGETLRRLGQVEMAQKVALRGLERRPHDAEAHDLLARIHVDRGALDSAFDEWDMVLRLAPGHAGALKGMGFVCFRQGKLEQAAQLLADASSFDPADASIASAIELVQRRLRGETAAAAFAGRAVDEVAAPAAAAPPAAAERPPVSRDGDSRLLFAELIGDGRQAALLLDAAGLVLAGAYMHADGRDVAQEVGAELSGVSDEALRAMRHLGLGAWSSIVFETQAATVALAPAPGDGLLVVAADRETPLGFVRRLLDRAAALSRDWLGGTP